jgi:hypothetical protein
MRGNITRRGKSSWRLKYDVGTGGQRQIVPASAQFHCKLSTVRPSMVSMRIVANKGGVTAPA